MSRSDWQQHESQSDQSLGRMIVASATLHVAVIVLVVIFTLRGSATHPLATAYTVELINPAALGTSIPGKKPRPAKPAEPAGQDSAPVAQPEAKPPVKEPPPAVVEPKPEKPPVVEKVEKVEKKEPPPVPPPPPDKDALKLAKEKLVEKPPEKKPVEQKPEVKKVEKKPEAEKPEAKPTTEKTPPKPEEKKPEAKKVESAAATEEEGEKKIRAALDRVAAVERVRLQERMRDQGGAEKTNDPRAPDVGSGSGPATIGGAAGEGGSGVVRGLEFIMYTQQVKRQVKEGWIVTERKPGLTAKVRFGVEPNGAIFGMELTKSSGDGTFDQSVLRAVQKANPLPPPPVLYQQAFVREKVEVTFGGEERVN